MLLLIDLVEVKRSRTFAQPIYGNSNSLHTRAFLKMHDLWPNNPCIRLQKFINQPFEGVGFRGCTTFDKPKQSVITLNQACGFVGNIRKAAANNFAYNFGESAILGHQITNPLKISAPASNKYPQGAIRLLTESGEGTSDIIPTLMCREHRDNRHQFSSLHPAEAISHEARRPVRNIITG